MEDPSRAGRDCFGGFLVNCDSLLIWKVASPGTRTRPGKVIAARLSKVQAEEMADTLRKDGVDVVVYRA